MKWIVAQPWFSFADLACAAAAVILIELFPGLGGWPLLISLIPWLARVGGGQAPFRSTHLDLPMALFLITAAIGVWAAYQPQAAWVKFWQIVSAILLFYSLTRLPESRITVLAELVGFVSIGISLVFLFSCDGAGIPDKFGQINRWLVEWVKIRPVTLPISLHPNETGGVIGLTGPFLVVSCIQAWKFRKPIPGFGYGAALCLVLVTLLLTQSRGAWLAIGAALICMGLVVVGRFVFQRFHRTGLLLGLGFVAGVAFLIWGFVSTLGMWDTLSRQVVEQLGSTNRIEVYRGTLELIRDYPFTGGGLNSYPGLYSQYIRIIPFFFLSHSHNVFLDVTLEQGVLGILALFWVLVVSFRFAISGLGNPKDRLIAYAVFSGLVILIIHGLTDDIVYAAGEPPLLFILPGIAAVIAPPSISQKSASASRISLVGISVAFASIFIICFFASKPLRASWYANLGAVLMAKTELAGFPSQQWKDESQLSGLKSSAVYFHQALTEDPANPTALYRLGLIDLAKRNFPEAVSVLQKAYGSEPDHRGIIKSLGLSYAWNSQIDSSMELLKGLPEMRAEAETYAWWWKTQERQDLSQNAAALTLALAGAN